MELPPLEAWAGSTACTHHGQAQLLAKLSGDCALGSSLREVGQQARARVKGGGMTKVLVL